MMTKMALETYPPARVPLRPVLATSELRMRAPRHPIPSVLHVGETALVTSGRVAVALALKDLRLEAGAEVLIPAYHCSSMVEPVVWIGARPVFFRVARDGAVNLHDLGRKLTKNTRALLAAHYFGFPQDMPSIRRFCDEHGIALIEDCAHAFFGSIGGRPFGSFGDYACASPWKFFPAYDGGCLVSARRSLAHIRLHSAGWRYELKSIINTLEQSFQYGRLPAARALLGAPLRVKDATLRWFKRRREGPVEQIGPSALDGGFAFEPAWVDKKMSLASQLLIRMAPSESIVNARRRNYLALLEALSDVPGARPLRPDLPDGTVPHVFPLVVDEAAAVFPELRRQAVPMLRFGEWLWPGVDESVCAISIELSRHVAQFPCHQGLSPEEIQWMIEKIHGALGRRRSRALVSRVA